MYVAHGEQFSRNFQHQFRTSDSKLYPVKTKACGSGSMNSGTEPVARYAR